MNPLAYSTAMKTFAKLCNRIKINKYTATWITIWEALFPSLPSLLSDLSVTSELQSKRGRSTPGFLLQRGDHAEPCAGRSEDHNLPLSLDEACGWQGFTLSCRGLTCSSLWEHNHPAHVLAGVGSEARRSLQRAFLTIEESAISMQAWSQDSK